MHYLKYYLPQLAERIWEKHRVGLGIFTIQGYERHKKESKNTLHQFSNKKGNVLI